MTPRASEPRLHGSDGRPSTAAEWDARLRAPGCTEADRAAFDAWCSESEAQANNFARLQLAVNALQAASSTDPHLRAMRDRARAAARQERLMRIAASIVAVISVAATSYFVIGHQSPAPPQSVYRTVAGERSTVRLADGSVVMLSSKSEMRVSFSGRRRDVTLVNGEAIFTVAKDHRRPFVVTAGRREVTAVGTVFDVKLDAQRLGVVLLEGRIEVGSPGLLIKKQRQVLLAGQRITVSLNSPNVKVEKADLARDTAWLDDRVVFEGETLDQAVAEINRYTDQTLTIADPTLKNLSVSGMFRTNQPERFVDAITGYYPIEARRTPSGQIRLLRK